MIGMYITLIIALALLITAGLCTPKKLHKANSKYYENGNHIYYDRKLINHIKNSKNNN